MPIGVCASAPDVWQGALGGRRARLDGVNWCFGPGGALVREFVQSPGGGYSWISELLHPAFNTEKKEGNENVVLRAKWAFPRTGEYSKCGKPAML